MRGFRKMEEDEIKGLRPINRPGWMGARGRRLRKLIGNKTWFRKRKKKGSDTKSRGKLGKKREVVKVKDVVCDRQIEAVMFVPYTRNSSLQKLLQETDDEFIRGGKSKIIRFVERGDKPWSTS